ncbi:MAG: glycosyltransferase family 4 protein [Chloroflexota bacterium]
MRIAMVAPLYESVPPNGYGGTERVVASLTDELVRRGHEVTLFASGDSRTSAHLVSICPAALRLGRRLDDPIAYHILQLGTVYQRAGEFDLIHSHCDFRAFPFAGLTATPTVSTNHNRLDSPENRAMLRAYPDAAVTALSDSHRRQLVGGRCVGVAYNGIPVADFPFHRSAGRYLAFVGRLSPEKGPLDAISAAERSGIPLKIAAKINEWEQSYFDTVLRSHLRPPRIEYVGELDEKRKRDLIGGALAVLCPLRWPEPFGLVMIEALAVGTPVLAYPSGAAPELVDDGVTGFLCADVDSLVDRVTRVPAIDRRACRESAERRFSVGAMADAYERAYQAVLASSGRPSPLRQAAS